MWIAFICTGVDFIAIFWFFSESRFSRESETISAPSMSAFESTDPGKAKESNVETLESANQGRFFEKKSYLAQLNPWSGRTKDENLLKSFVRPFPLILYPAIFWVFASCKLLQSDVALVLNLEKLIALSRLNLPGRLHMRGGAELVYLSDCPIQLFCSDQWTDQCRISQEVRAHKSANIL